MLKQETNETATMYATRVKCLYRIAYPEMTENLEKNLNVKDKFLTGLSDTNQKKYVLEHRSIEDDLNALLQLAIKFESIQILIQPNASH